MEPPPHFHAVADHVVGVGAHGRRIRVQQGDVLILGMRERMVHGHEPAFLLAPLEHGEVHHPQQREFVFVAQAKAVAHLEAQFAKLLARLHGIVAAQYENQVARCGLHGLFQLLEHFLRVELVHAGLHAAVFLHSGIYQAFRANLAALHEISELVQLFPRIGSTARRTDAADVAGVVEY